MNLSIDFIFAVSDQISHCVFSSTSEFTASWFRRSTYYIVIIIVVITVIILVSTDSHKRHTREYTQCEKWLKWSPASESRWRFRSMAASWTSLCKSSIWWCPLHTITTASIICINYPAVSRVTRQKNARKTEAILVQQITRHSQRQANAHRFQQQNDIGDFRTFYADCNGSWQFLSRVSMLTRDIDIAILSVRPSARLSVTFRYFMETA